MVEAALVQEEAALHPMEEVVVQQVEAAALHPMEAVVQQVEAVAQQVEEAALHPMEEAAARLQAEAVVQQMTPSRRTRTTGRENCSEITTRTSPALHPMEEAAARLQAEAVVQEEAALHPMEEAAARLPAEAVTQQVKEEPTSSDRPLPTGHLPPTRNRQNSRCLEASSSYGETTAHPS